MTPFVWTVRVQEACGMAAATVILIVGLGSGPFWWRVVSDPSVSGNMSQPFAGTSSNVYAGTNTLPIRSPTGLLGVRPLISGTERPTVFGRQISIVYIGV